MLRNLLLAVFAIFFVTACGKKTEFVVPEGDRKPSEKIDDSFEVIAPIQPGPNKAEIAIRKSALGKEFLLSAQMIRLPGVRQFNGSKSRVVLFHKVDDSLFMLESPDGKMINKEDAARFILAEFPITQNTDEYIVFDFNEGMKQSYTASDWRASDFEGPAYNSNTDFNSVDVRASLIAEAYMSASQKLVIRQAAQLTVEKDQKNHNSNVETLFYIAPYIQNENFKPTLSEGFDRTGFFEIAPLLNNIDTKIYATKFGDGPVTFAISANTPELYLEAVREGVLYWNKAFGYEKLKVVVAPEGINAPHPDYNIVQWVNWDTAGMAYADAQMDPRTGEILHAQVFQTSVFAIANKNRARKYLRGIKDQAKKRDNSGHHHVGLAGFTTKGLCNLDHQEAATDLAKKIIALDADEETALRLSQDMVRQVVAHEIGHTLGFRHNFAGNLSANFTADQVDDLFKLYVEGSQDISKIPTSSVMDYLRMESAMPAGALLKSKDSAFSYDTMATQILYHDATISNANIPLFCTDSHRGKYLGCDIWDHGRSPALDIQRKKDVGLENWSRDLVEKFISGLTNPTSRRPSPSEIVLSPKGDLKMALSYRDLLFKLVEEDTKDIRVYRLFEKVDETNRRKIEKSQKELWTREVNKLGGMKEFLVRPSASLVSELRSKAIRLLNSPQYQSGVGYDAKPYTLSASQTQEIELVLEDYFTELELVLAETDLETLIKEQRKLSDIELSDQLEEVFYNRSLRYLVAETDKKIVGDIKVGDEKSIRVSLPVYKYSQELRTKAIQLLSDQKSVEMDWAYDAKANLKSIYEASLKSALNDNKLDDVKVEESKGEARLWLLQNKELWGKASSL